MPHASTESASTQTQFSRIQYGMVNAEISPELASNEEIKRLLKMIKEWERGFSNIYDKYDRVKAQLGATMTEADTLTKRTEDLTRLLGRERETTQSLRDVQRREHDLYEQVKKDLAELSTSNPESTEDTAATLRAELAKEKIRSTTLSEDLDKARHGKLSELEKQVATQKSELEFLRTQYQDRDRDLTVARQDSAELEEANRKLKAQVESARATKESAKLRDANHAEEMKVLRAQLDAATKQQQKKERERGRGMATRSGSVAPRSPRVGASPAGSRVVSRHGSPVRREGVLGRRGRQQASFQ